MNHFRAGVKGVVILTPLLGINWLFGLLAVNKHLVVFEFMFVLLNSLQGLFIFLFHCVGSSEVSRHSWCKGIYHLHVNIWPFIFPVCDLEDHQPSSKLCLHKSKQGCVPGACKLWVIEISENQCRFKVSYFVLEIEFWRYFIAKLPTLI